MKKILVIFLFLTLTFTANIVKADIPHFIDFSKVLNQSTAGKKAQDFLKKSYSQNAKKYSNMEEELKKEESDLLKKKTVLSKEEYKKNSDELRKKVIEYQSARRASLDKISLQRRESREDLIKAIDPILATYIKENNVSIVIDKKNTLGGNPDKDITKFIVEKLNKKLPSLKLK